MNEQTQVGNVSIGDTQYQGDQIQNEQHPYGSCPNCGYCPHCGRRNAQPYNPWYPSWSSPVITCNAVGVIGTVGAQFC